MNKPESDQPAPSAAVGADRDMGAALRRVYQSTVDESVPDELLSLLGKLD